MKSVLLLAAAMSLGHAAFAATEPVAPETTTPAEPTTEKEKDETADFDPDALALVDQSATAYKKLNGLFMTFSARDQRTDAVTPSTLGTIAIQRPVCVHVSIRYNGQVQNINSNAEAPNADRVTQQGSDMLMSDSMMAIPIGASGPLSFLIIGKNPLRGKRSNNQPFHWKDVKILPDGSVTMSRDIEGADGTKDGSSVTFELAFDPTDHLLRRVKLTSITAGKQSVNLTTFAQVQLDPVFAPNTFADNPNAVG